MAYYGQNSYSAYASDVPYSETGSWDGMTGGEYGADGSAQNRQSAPHDDLAYSSSYPLDPAREDEAPWGTDSGRGAFAPSVSSGVTAQHQPNSADGSTKQRRKVKLYNLPKQDDPEEERRRLRAIKQKDKRERVHKEEVNMKQATNKARDDIKNMRIEREMRSCNISMMEYLLSMNESAMCQKQPGAF